MAALVVLYQFHVHHIIALFNCFSPIFLVNTSLHSQCSTNFMFILSLCCLVVLQQFYYTSLKMWPIQFYIFVSHQPLVLYQKAFCCFCSKCSKFVPHGGKMSPLLHFRWQMLSLIPKQIPCPVGHCNANVQIYLYLESAPSYY